MKLMNTQVQLVLLAILLLATMIGGYAIGAKIERDNSSKSIRELLSSKELLYAEVKNAKTKSTSLGKALSELSDKNTELLDLVAQLQDRPEKIRYVTITEAIVKPLEPTVATAEPPTEHVFLLQDNLAVARFAYDSEAEFPYSFETYELTFRNSVILSEKNASGLLQIASSANPDVFLEVPIDSFEVRIIDELRLFEPNVGISLTISANETPDLLGSVFVSFLHPHKNVDVIGLRIAVNGQVAQFGADLAGYNIAAHVPVLTDLWVHTGIGVDLHAKPSGHLSLGTKF